MIPYLYMTAIGNIYITSVHPWLADAYGAGPYGNSTYSCNSATSTCGRPAASGGLVNTGVAVGLFVGVAALILLAVVVIRFWRRPADVDKDKKISQNKV